MWLTFLIVIVVDWSGASVTLRGLSGSSAPLESTLAERKSTTSYDVVFVFVGPPVVFLGITFIGITIVCGFIIILTKKHFKSRGV